MIPLVLLDIDGTLLDTGGAGRRSFQRALEEVAGHPVQALDYDFAGRTDLAILRTLIERVRPGAPEDPSVRDRVLDRYLDHLKVELANTDRERGRQPGVEELLRMLAADASWRVGLLTGNLEGGARLKLAHYGIDHYFEFGAFGSDDEERDRLVPIARARAAERFGASFDEAPVVLVGDTPLDIRCARAGGAAILAVATGLFTRQELAAHHPDALLRDLSDTQEVMAILQRLRSLPRPPAAPPTPRIDR